MNYAGCAIKVRWQKLGTFDIVSDFNRRRDFTVPSGVAVLRYDALNLSNNKTGVVSAEPE